MIIVSGLSGSGKSIALQTLEDLDYYCVDNLPLELLKPFAEALLRRAAERQQTRRPTAVGIDARNFLDELPRFPQVLADLRALGLDVEVLFLHADDEALLKRYSETRRRHPLSVGGVPLGEAIRQERQLLEEITAHATLIVDTSHSNIHELRELIRNRIHDTPPHSLSLLFESFGYKNGLPADADFVFDVRCLPNPHWEPKLRALSGLDAPVIEFLRSHEAVKRMIDDIQTFLETWLPSFVAGSRSYLTVAIGCTGGQHRSVYIANALAKYFGARRRNVMTRHRELTR
jgi:UPF0042 nucleotide-binding protein